MSENQKKHTAAAPDLLEALKELVAAVERADNPGDQGLGCTDDAFLKAKAAIAVAEGFS